MIDRRQLLTATAATAVAGVARATTAGASTLDVKVDPWHEPQAFLSAHTVDFPRVGANSQQDFANGFRRFLSRQGALPAATAHTQSFLKSKGLSMLDNTDLPLEKCFNVMMEDPVYAVHQRLTRSNQTLMWDRARRAFDKDADKYFTAMEKTDKAGPGTLEMNPQMDLPDYTRYEIHTMPGGYVGHPFAGWIYHYALDAGFYHDAVHGDNMHDEVFEAMAQAHPLPTDGKVMRILDIGCGCGQFTTAMKDRFPNAEVWGIEVGGPMVRYAHHRAVKLKSEIHFAQRLAEDTKFPDGYFDIVSDHILFHEVPAAAAKQIVAEAYRVLRPGGVFNHMDVQTEGDPHAPLVDTVMGRASRWANHRHNVERWQLEYQATNFPGLLAQTGFKVDLDLKAFRSNMYPGVLGRKPA